MKRRILNLIRFIGDSFKTPKYVPIVHPIGKNELLKGKTALITGGSSGIGFAIAKSFIECGANVIIASRNQNKLSECCKELGEKSRFLVLDIMDVKSFDSKISTACTLFDGCYTIDILVNSAGIVPKSNDFFSINEDEYDLIMDTNIKGTFFLSQKVAKYMIDHNIKGHILNVSSSSALRPAWTPYQISKWSIKGFTLGLADTLIKNGIVVNAIAPGPTLTPMLGKKEDDSLYCPNPVNRYALPLEIASAAVFLVSGLGDLVIGDTLYMTGGSGVITYHS